MSEDNGIVIPNLPNGVRSTYIVPCPIPQVRHFGIEAVQRGSSGANVNITLSVGEKQNLADVAELFGCSKAYIVRWLVMAFTMQVLKDAGRKHYRWDELRNFDPSGRSKAE